MLVLTRRPGESIICTLEDGRRIEFMVLSVQGNQVRAGVTAPKTVGVDREEVHVRKFGEVHG